LVIITARWDHQRPASNADHRGCELRTARFIVAEMKLADLMDTMARAVSPFASGMFRQPPLPVRMTAISYTVRISHEKKLRTVKMPTIAGWELWMPCPTTFRFSWNEIARLC
jgi:hypothetical protein